MQYRHAIIAPSQFDAYGGSAFPGLGKLNCKKILQSVYSIMYMILAENKKTNFSQPLREKNENKVHPPVKCI